MKAKRYNKKNKIIYFLITFSFIVVMIISGINIFNWVRENKQTESIMENIIKTVVIYEDIETIEKYNIDFSSLNKTNSDTVGWLKVNNTNIEYPVVKATNNNYYMTHSFDKSNNSAGWVFVDYKNKMDGTDKNIVIYGHNRRDGSMFGTLKNILNNDWQENGENYIIPLITEKEKAEYQVFSVYQIEKEDYYITTNFGNDSEFEAFLNKIKSRSKKNFGIQVTKDDKILTLSTCADNNKYRVVLHAKKI